MHLKRKQSGHAALLFAMLIPALFGIFTLASDGARALQSKARIEDAAEVASLAIAAHNAQNTNTDGAGSGSSINRKIATDYIEQYMPDMTQIADLKIYKHDCEDIPECKAGLKRGEARYFQYEVETKTTHQSWFPGNEAIQGFGETFDVAGAAVARKYQSEAVDVIIVADFSGSMKERWTGNRVKYKDLIDIIGDVTDELERFNKLEDGNDNNIGIVPFNFYTHSIVMGTNYNCSMNQLYYNGGNINPSATVSHLWEEKTESFCSDNNKGEFYDLPLTSSFDSFNKEIEKFKPNDGTASYQGIIRGAQLLKKGKNSRRLLVVMSDGVDWEEHATYSANLVSAGMCGEVQRGLNTGTSSDGKDIKARMAVIGFDYEPKDNKALEDCVGSKNVFKAEKKEEILSQILELITEEIGHLK